MRLKLGSGRLSDTGKLKKSKELKKLRKGGENMCRY